MLGAVLFFAGVLVMLCGMTWILREPAFRCHYCRKSLPDEGYMAVTGGGDFICRKCAAQEHGRLYRWCDEFDPDTR